MSYDKEKKRERDRKRRSSPEWKKRENERLRKLWETDVDYRNARGERNRNHYARSMLDPEWVAKERERGRQKYWDKLAAGWKPKCLTTYSQTKARNYAGLRARDIANKKIEIPVGTLCICGKLATHKHHPDYSKPLLVEFLCSICHGKKHRKKDLEAKINGRSEN